MEDDNPTVEREIRQGGLTPQNVDPRMFHDIQVILVSGSWENRCMGAGLRQNLGPEVWTKVTHTSPNKVFTDVTQSTANRVATDRKRKATDTAKEQRRESKYTKLDDTPAAHRAYDRHGDGISPDDVSEDIPPAQLQSMADSYYETKVKLPEQRVKEIEQSTREQSDSDQWRLERRK